MFFTLVLNGSKACHCIQGPKTIYIQPDAIATNFLWSPPFFPTRSSSNSHLSHTNNAAYSNISVKRQLVTSALLYSLLLQFPFSTCVALEKKAHYVPAEVHKILQQNVMLSKLNKLQTGTSMAHSIRTIRTNCPKYVIINMPTGGGTLMRWRGQTIFFFLFRLAPACCYQIWKWVVIKIAIN